MPQKHSIPFGPYSTSYSCGSDANKYKYGFNGKEKDNETNVEGGDYDFGARIYDSRLGRWLSLDPLFKNYPNLSSFNFAGNSPIIFIDKAGDKIIIHYDSGEKDAEGHCIMKSYVYGSGLPVPDNKFVTETIASLDMISKVNISQYPNSPDFPTPSEMLNRLASDPQSTVNIMSSQSGNAHNPPRITGSITPEECNETSVLFNSTTSKYTSKSTDLNRLPRPPAASLNHEIKHAFNFLYNYCNYIDNKGSEPLVGFQGNAIQFSNREEEFTTLKTDNDFAAYYCLDLRKDYFTENGPETTSSTSIQPKYLVNDPVSNSSSTSEAKVTTKKNNNTWN